MFPQLFSDAGALMRMLPTMSAELNLTLENSFSFFFRQNMAGIGENVKLILNVIEEFVISYILEL